MLIGPRRASQSGVSLVEMVVAAGLVAIVAVVIIISGAVNQKQTGSSDIDNIEKAARTLADLGEALSLWTNKGSGKQTSFFQVVQGANPGVLSHLTFQITTSQRNSCARGTPLKNATKYSVPQTNRWTGGFFRQELPTTGFLIAPGFFANDTMLRYSAVYNPAGPPYFVEQYFPTGDTKTPGTLAIVMPNVAYTDAIALAQRVEGDTIGIRGAVRFLRNAFNTPVTVEYHIGIHGC